VNPVSKSDSLYSGNGGTIFGMYRPVMRTIHHNPTRLNKSDETGIAVLQNERTRILVTIFFVHCIKFIIATKGT
jgi:hypothetical protein